VEIDAAKDARASPKAGWNLVAPQDSSIQTA